ncbi:MAG: hypothetical protein MSH18_04420, partial [Bacteroidales bacterium]|nr:hypothetical protein [Bacteroidales bacterium]
MAESRKSPILSFPFHSPLGLPSVGRRMGLLFIYIRYMPMRILMVNTSERTGGAAIAANRLM